MALPTNNSDTLPELTQDSLDRVAVVAALPAGSHIHVSGVCGTGMAAVATLLKSLGFRVSGSDKAFYPPMGDVVRNTVDQVYEGYAAENFATRPDLVVIGNNLRKDNPEVLAVMEQGIPFASMPEVFSALLIGSRDHCACSVVASGTHGKTTTSAMVATLFESAGWNPAYFIGGVPRSLNSSLRAVDTSKPLEQRLVVLEGDEYDSAFFAKWPKFHSYRPDILIVTSLEFDHADIYKDIGQIETEFTRVMRRVPKDGKILVCQDSEGLDSLAKVWKEDSQIEAEILLYGSSEKTDYRLVSRESQGLEKQVIKFLLRGQEIEFETSESGLHNSLNFLATAAVGSLRGLSQEQIKKGLSDFRSVKRRQEIIHQTEELLVIEDFAHHPTAVKLTLEGIRDVYPDSRIIAVFEPRSNTSRRAYFQQDYISSFSSADKVLIKKVEDAGTYSATGDDIVALDVDVLVEGINKLGVNAEAISDVEIILKELLELKQPGDVVVLMSNGDFAGLPKLLVQALSN